MSEVKTNKITSLASNNDITLDPDGTGDTIIASGNVGIGTTTVDSALHIEQDASGVTETSGSTLKIHNTNASGRSKISLHNSGETASGSIYYDTDVGGLALQGDTGAIVTINTGGNNERMRIDTSGNVAIGQTSVGLSTVGCNIRPIGLVQAVRDDAATIEIRRNNSDGSIQTFRRDGTQVGRIDVTSSSTSYVTSSDYRLKQGVEDMTGAIDRVKNLSPRRFEFIIDPDTTVDGFIAHEVSSVVPEAVTGQKDAVDADGNIEPQGIDQSKLVPLLTAALKESITKIETLETEMTALKARVTALEDA